jgi:hypothetical protein
MKFKFNVIEVVESPVADVYSTPRAQLLIPEVMPTELTNALAVVVGRRSVPYEPEPLEARVNHKFPVVEVVPATVEEIASVPGTAAFAVENEVAGAEITRARTPVESPIA